MSTAGGGVNCGASLEGVIMNETIDSSKSRSRSDVERPDYMFASIPREVEAANEQRFSRASDLMWHDRVS